MPGEDVEELGELVQAPGAQDATDPGDARVAVQLEQRPVGLVPDRSQGGQAVLGVGHHRAELVDVEDRAVLAEAALAEQDRPRARQPHGQGAGDHDGGEHRDQQAGHDQVEGTLEGLLAAGELDPAQAKDGHVVEALDGDPAGGHAQHPGGEVEVDGQLLQVAVDPLGGLGGDRAAGDQHGVGLVLADGLADLGAGPDDLGKAGGGRADGSGVVEEADDLEPEVAGAGHGPAEVAAVAAGPDDQQAADQGAGAAHGPQQPAVDEAGGQHGDGAAGPGGQHPGALGRDLEDEGGEGDGDGAGGDRLEDELELLGGVEEPA